MPKHTSEDQVKLPKCKSCDQNISIHDKTQKPKATLVGDSMIRGTGKTISQKLPQYDTCVLSKSGYRISNATVDLPSVLGDLTNKDVVALQVGTNDVAKHTHEELVVMYKWIAMVQWLASGTPTRTIQVRFPSDWFLHHGDNRGRHF